MGISNLHERIGMKCLYLRWVLRTLTDIQKADRVRYAQEMTQVLDNRSRTGFKYPLTGDESRVTHHKGPTQMWPRPELRQRKGLPD
jgi:hypothetical protein